MIWPWLKLQCSLNTTPASETIRESCRGECWCGKSSSELINVIFRSASAYVNHGGYCYNFLLYGAHTHFYSRLRSVRTYKLFAGLNSRDFTFIWNNCYWLSRLVRAMVVIMVVIQYWSRFPLQDDLSSTWTSCTWRGSVSWLNTFSLEVPYPICCCWRISATFFSRLIIMLSIDNNDMTLIIYFNRVYFVI